MTKADLIHKIIYSTNVSREDVTTTIEKAMKVIKDQVVSGKSVYLRGFGTFRTKTRKQKPARNITTGETLLVPERSIPAFIPAREFKEQTIKTSRA